MPMFRVKVNIDETLRCDGWVVVEAESRDVAMRAVFDPSNHLYSKTGHVLERRCWEVVEAFSAESEVLPAEWED